MIKSQAVRLTEHEIKAVLESLKKVIPINVRACWLYGSRVDLSKRGKD